MFEEVIDAAGDMRFVAKDASVNFKEELAASEVNVDEAFKDQYIN